MAATIIQANGTASGYLLDPDTGEHLASHIQRQRLLVFGVRWAEACEQTAAEASTYVIAC